MKNQTTFSISELDLRPIKRQSKEIAAIVSEVAEWAQKAAEVYRLPNHAAASETVARNAFSANPSPETFAELSKAIERRAAVERAMASEFKSLSADRAAERHRDKHKDARPLAAELCGAVVPQLQRLHAASCQQDVKAAQALGLHRIESARTKAIAELLIEATAGRFSTACKFASAALGREIDSATASVF